MIKLPSPEQVLRNRELVEMLLEHLKLTKYVHLASALKVEYAVICKIRSGDIPVSNTVLIRIHEEVGIPFSALRKFVPKAYANE